MTCKKCGHRSVISLFDDINYCADCAEHLISSFCRRVWELEEELEGERLWIKEVKKLYDIQHDILGELRILFPGKAVVNIPDEVRKLQNKLKDEQRWIRDSGFG